LDIPTVKKTGAPDKRYTAGIYNSARDLLDRRKYMSVAGGPSGEYQIDLLDMGVKGKLYNKQFWYLLTALNTNSRYVYACPVKKGADAKKGETKLTRQEDRNLSNDPIEEPQWIQKQIIPAMERIMAQIEADINADTQGVLEHRRIKSVMMDSGAEFQVTFRAWLAQQDISSIVCAPETHEQMSRLNSFHRYFRQRYNVQWRKYFEDPRGYGGPVRWINPRADLLQGFAAAPSEDGLIESQQDAARGLAEMPDLSGVVEEEQDAGDMGGGAAPAADDNQGDTWDEQYAPEEQKLAAETGVWRVTYWQDWVNAHNTTVKAQSLRGAEVRETKKNGQRRTLRLAKAPAEITDQMVHNLIRYDAGRREVVKQRVDQWVRDHAVVTEAELPADKKGVATRVRLDLNRSKYGTEIKQKGTTFLSIWSERHYPLAARVGTNTFSVSHEAGSDFPKVWPVYRLRIVVNPSNVAQPASKEVKVGPADAKVRIADDRLTAQTKRDAQVLKEIKAREEKEKKDQERQLALRAKELEKQAQEGYDEQARVRASENGAAAKKKKSHRRAKPRGPPAQPTREGTRARKQTVLFVPP